jgi:predicted dehydrogenase
MGRWHAVSAQRAGGRIVAVLDRNEEACRELARSFRAQAFQNVEALPPASNLAVAHVCTPLATHEPFASALLDRNYHVICEKPLTASAAALEALLGKARKAGRMLIGVHQFVAQRGTRKVLMNREKLGRLRHVQFTFCSAGAAHQPSASLDSLVLEILPHPLSILGQLQPGVPLSGVDWQVRRSAPGEFHASGLHGEIAVSILISLSARPTTAGATLYGTAATGFLDFYHGYSFFHRAALGRVGKIVSPFASSLRKLTAAGANLAGRAMRRESAYPGLRDFFADAYDRLSTAPFDAEDAALIDLYRARDTLAARFHPEPRADSESRP